MAGQGVSNDVLFPSHPLHTERLVQDPFAQPGDFGVVNLRHVLGENPHERSVISEDLEVVDSF